MEIKQPLVSIIVPNYNHEKYLVQRLESIFNQTYSKFEVILLDDCSNDKSSEVLNRYKEDQKVSACLFNEINSGNTFKQWVKGISIAKGDLIWIAETDDFCDSNFLERLMLPFQQDSQVVLTYCQSNRVNENGEITGNWITHTNNLNPDLFTKDFILDGNFFLEKYLIDRNVIPNASAVLFKREAVDINEQIDVSPNFRTCGDWMFYSKLIINNKVAFLHDSLNNFRYHSESVIAQTIDNQNKLALIDIDIQMRNCMIAYLRSKKIPNFEKIKARNNYLKRNLLIYEKAILLLQSGRILKGSFLFFSIYDVFFKKINLRRKILQGLIKISNLFK